MTTDSASRTEETLIERLRRHVDVLAGLIGPRSLHRPSALDAAAAMVMNELPSGGESVARLPYRVGAHEVANLVLERRGATRPDEIVVIGAHYDTVAYPPTPGADDNASAVAVLIEAARLLAGRSLPRTVRFVAFPNEEPPYFYTDEMGSQVYAAECRRRGDRIVAMLCLEMVGYFTDKPNSQELPPGIPKILRPLLPTTGNFLAAVGNLASKRLCMQFYRGFRKGSKLPLWALPLPEKIHEIRLSDNSSFWDHGYPALMITDTSFLRNPHYHQVSDRPETLNYAAMAKVTKGVAAAVEYIATA